MRSENTGEQCSGCVSSGGDRRGSKTSEICIENGRFHGQQIAADLSRRLKK